MADPLTWPAVVMGVFTVLNGSVLVPVVRAWKRNRASGKQRDAVVDNLAGRMEAAMREFGAQLAALNQAAWSAAGRCDVLDTRAANLERELEHVRRKLDALEARR